MNNKDVNVHKETLRNCKKDETMQFAEIQMELEDTMLTEKLRK